MKKTIAIILSTLIIFWACGGGEPETYQPQAPDKTSEIIMLGDSFMASHDWSDDFPGVTVHNEGISGETTAEILLRVPAVIAKYEPQPVFIIAGINDIEVESLQPWEAMDNYTQIIEQLTYYGFEVIVVSTCYIADTTIGSYNKNNLVAELDFLLEQYCFHNYMVFIDLAASVCPLGCLDKRFDLGDGVHLNGRGYGVMVDLVSTYKKL